MENKEEEKIPIIENKEESNDIEENQDESIIVDPDNPNRHTYAK